jgi:4-hydroxybenzoate polyprenyltransferase
MRTARALWGSTHPGPTLVVTALAVALGIATGLEPWRLILLGVAVLFNQISIGISNDAIDARRDREVGRDDKPIARGDVSTGVAWAVAVGAVAISLGVSLVLSPAMAVANLVAIAGGWAYNAGLKATAFSVVPFIVSFGLFPSLATLAAPDPSLAAGWATFAGAVLGIAVHLSNVLPDLDDDARTGIRGLPHRIGARASSVVCALALAAGAVAVLLGPVGGDGAAVSPLSWVFFVLVLAVAVAALLLALLRPPGRAVFRLVMLAALLLATQLVATGRALSG